MNNHHGMMDQSSDSLSQCDDPNRHFDNEVVEYRDKVLKIIEIIMEKEIELKRKEPETSRPIESLTFDELIKDYSEHEQFFIDICQFAKDTIEKCCEEGQAKQELNFLTHEDKEEIGFSIDTMTTNFLKLKVLAFDGLMRLRVFIEKRQQNKIDVFNEWLTELELKIARINPTIGPDIPSLRTQMKDLEDLQTELEQKQEILNFMEDFIIFDEIDPSTLEMRPKSSSQFDDELVSINRRWTEICKFVKQKGNNLKKADSIWLLITHESPDLVNWLFKLETDLNEMLEASKNVTDGSNDRDFIEKLTTRSNKIEQDIKKKQTLYSSLEHRVRDKIHKVQETCPLVVVEIERKLDDLQDNWNLILNRKRTLDFKLQALSNHKHALSNDTNVTFNMIPVPDPITKNSNNDVRFNSSNFISSLSQNNLGSQDYSCVVKCDRLNDNSSLASSNSELRRSDSKFDSLSEPKISAETSPNKLRGYIQGNTISNSDTMEIFLANNDICMDKKRSMSDLESQSANDGAYSVLKPVENGQNMGGKNECCAPGYDGCRVEAWKQELESFSVWLKHIEVSLGVDTDYLVNDESPIWNELDLEGRINLLSEVEHENATIYCDKFDSLLVQGQQIIVDFTPEMDEEDGKNLKCILNDFEHRYSSVRQCLETKQNEIVEGWKNLLNDLIDLSDLLIEKMAKVIPEDEIGFDLITLAQQQDELMQTKSCLNENDKIAACIQDVKLFLRLYMESKQKSQMMSDSHESYEIIAFNLNDPEFEKLKDDIENQYDRLSLHLSELLQIIDERLGICADVHKKMHLLQHRIQDFAEKLQVAEILKSNWIPLDGLTVEKLSEQLEDLKMYRDNLSEIESIHNQMNGIVKALLADEVQLNHQNLNRVNELNLIWDLIEAAVDDRQKQIEKAFENEGSAEQQFLACTVDLPWERRVATTSKVPYFKNRNTNETKWDHPKLTDLLNSMDALEEVVFSAYRTALKLRLIQRSLGIDLIMLESLKEIFESTGVGEQNNNNRQDDKTKSKDTNDDNGTAAIITKPQYNGHHKEALVGVKQIIRCLEAIFEHIQNTETLPLEVSTAIDLTLNWLLNLYDPTRTGYITALALKIGLTLVCCATREEKYIYIYQLIENPRTKNVDARKLGSILEICVQIANYLGEGESFGGPGVIDNTVRDCLNYSKYDPQHPNCINLSGYLNWLKTEPQCIIWLPVFHRLLISENARHPVKCKLCRVTPIVGLRYKCIRTFNFDICQNCFLAGRHIFELKNPDKYVMQEYCTATSSGERFRDFTKILRNKVRAGKHKT